jgi:COP9 signalosome complex subunit 3
MLNAANELISEDVFEVDPAKTGLTPTDLFLYCYYGSMVAAGARSSIRRGQWFKECTIDAQLI